MLCIIVKLIKKGYELLEKVRKYSNKCFDFLELSLLAVPLIYQLNWVAIMQFFQLADCF